MSAVERALMLLGVIVTLALFGYIAYEASTTPSAPELSVAVEPVEGGARVVLANTGGAGAADAVVEARCGSAQQIVLEFHDIPARSAREAFVACEGGVTATLAWWTEAGA